MKDGVVDDTLLAHQRKGSQLIALLIIPFSCALKLCLFIYLCLVWHTKFHPNTQGTACITNE